MVFAVKVPPINDCTIQMGTYFQGGNDNSVSSKLRLTSAKHPCHSPWLTVDESSARHVMLDRFIQNCGCFLQHGKSICFHRDFMS